MIKSLELHGRLRNRDNHPMVSSYSWPEGVSYSEALAHVEEYAKAFILDRAILNGQLR